MHQVTSTSSYRGTAGFRAREDDENHGDDHYVAPAAPLKGDGHLTAFGKLYPAEAAWLVKNAGKAAFADSLLGRIRGGRILSSGQLVALQKAAKEAGAPKVPAPTVDASKIEQAFATAIEKGVSKPRMNLGGFKLRLGTGAHEGAVFVREGEQYLGKVLKGQFLATRECKEAGKVEEVLAAIENPHKSAIAYGQRTGNCAMCGRSLIVTSSVDLGIGPICAEKYGFI